jgi:hypothetical protein
VDAGDTNQHLYIQPNRGDATEVSCKISNVTLYKTLTSQESVKSIDRVASAYITVDILLETGTKIERSFSAKGTFLAGKSTCVME